MSYTYVPFSLLPHDMCLVSPNLFLTLPFAQLGNHHHFRLSTCQLVSVFIWSKNCRHSNLVQSTFIFRQGAFWSVCVKSFNLCYILGLNAIILGIMITELFIFHESGSCFCSFFKERQIRGCRYQGIFWIMRGHYARAGLGGTFTSLYSICTSTLRNILHFLINQLFTSRHSPLLFQWLCTCHAVFIKLSVTDISGQALRQPLLSNAHPSRKPPLGKFSTHPGRIPFNKFAFTAMLAIIMVISTH